MKTHTLTPIYKPVSWDIDPKLLEEVPELRAYQEKAMVELGERLQRRLEEAACGRLFTCSVPRVRLIDDEFGTYGITADSLFFTAAMLKP